MGGHMPLTTAPPRVRGRGRYAMRVNHLKHPMRRMPFHALDRLVASCRAISTRFGADRHHREIPGGNSKCP
eukprot:6941668-Lingulodinium_polyedra.AAC.1